MRRIFWLVTYLSIFTCCNADDTIAFAQNLDQTIQTIRLHQTQLIQKMQTKTLTIEDIKQSIHQLCDIDQAMRHQAIATININEAHPLMHKLHLMDQMTSKIIKHLYLYHGSWFKISVFGPQTDHEAWLIIQHSADIHFQEKVLYDLSLLIGCNETSRENYAFLYDRVHLNKEGTQRYGTQNRWDTLQKKYVLSPLADASNLDHNRRMMGLISVKKQQQLLEQIYAPTIARNQ